MSATIRRSCIDHGQLRFKLGVDDIQLGDQLKWVLKLTKWSHGDSNTKHDPQDARFSNYADLDIKQKQA